MLDLSAFLAFERTLYWDDVKVHNVKLVIQQTAVLDEMYNPMRLRG